ncbi:hypothetical protein TNCV_2434471 [Trichonephila clavipes]|nr:hypothetical protein TNCV_2434471 [Trichonephila clavipes]
MIELESADTEIRGCSAVALRICRQAVLLVFRLGHCDLGYLPTNEKNDWCRIRAHYVRISEFERGWKIGESLVIWVEAMRPLQDADKNGWTVTDFSVMM